MDAFTAAYIECALWSSVDEEGNPLDDSYGPEDLSAATLAQMESDCEDFQVANAAMLEQAGNDEQNGHDFWLTRNRHGAGFWDRGYPDAIANALTDAAHAYGSCDLYIGVGGIIDC